MAFPTLDPAELAHRLGLVVDPETQARLTTALSVAAGILDPRCDPIKVTQRPDTYMEAGYQLGVKVWESATRGLLGVDAVGMYDLAPQATAGLWRSVLGIAQPVLTTGGAVVG